MEEALRRLIGGPHPEDVGGILSSETATDVRERLEAKRATSVDEKGKLRERFEWYSTRRFSSTSSTDSRTHSKRARASRGATVQCVPAPVAMELTYGAEFGGEAKRRNVRNALRMSPIVDQDETIAHRAGQLLARADQEADDEDGIDQVAPMVASVSDIYDEPVLTANVEHFERLGVEIGTY